MSLTEKDLVKIILDSPLYLKVALGHKEEPVTYNNEDERKKMIKFIYKSWSGLSKYIKRQID